jgi:hypothetical protein
MQVRLAEDGDSSLCEHNFHRTVIFGNNSIVCF